MDSHSNTVSVSDREPPEEHENNGVGAGQLRRLSSSSSSSTREDNADPVDMSPTTTTIESQSAAAVSEEEEEGNEEEASRVLLAEVKALSYLIFTEEVSPEDEEEVLLNNNNNACHTVDNDVVIEETSQTTTETETVNSDNENNNNNNEKKATGSTTSTSTSCPPFVMGDHVYRWCSFALVPAVYQHHGIVMDVWKSNNNDDDDDDDNDNNEEVEWILKIADFSNLQRVDADNENNIKSGGLSKTNGAPSCIRIYESSCYSSSSTTTNGSSDGSTACDWHVVEYSSKRNFFHHHFLSRSGTFTTADCSPPGLVRARLEFLLNHPHVLPNYNSTLANCECVAVWCKTGTWATLQGTSWLTYLAAGQVKSAATLAGVASATQVTVPAAGLWGWFGYTTQVSLASTQPFLLPAIAAYGAVTVATPLLLLWRARAKWKATTLQLNTAFWEAAIDQPEIFVECITEWSSLGGGTRTPRDTVEEEEEAEENVIVLQAQDQDEGRQQQQQEEEEQAHSQQSQDQAQSS